ncbi:MULTISPECIES: GGDEF domain-containing protein [Roseateles]|uniref:diguanylate cyclase n=1 Tax=Roseateles albus TaxID=2987525 RepID=A0ABT5KB01_9BURK|nr:MULTISPECIES: GGDEF domain-containing protein [Roseateles]MCV2359013.1 GGDEF domain-containing protein [Paucibacter sp. TC2R-5]MDC8771117.1 GGDEF domain-containing protein [Roseateles albus]
MPNLIADQLNGLMDRQALQALMEQAATAARSSGQSLAVLTLDLDHFKAYLEDQGQSQAQTVLQSAAKLFADRMPAGASLAHLGGDEFVMLLPATDLAAAVATAETLRAAVEAEFASLGGPTPLTVTLGAAASPSGSDWTARSLLALADARMTFGKKRLLPHHNRVWSGTLPSDWYPRFDVQAEVWPSL